MATAKIRVGVIGASMRNGWGAMPTFRPCARFLDAKWGNGFRSPKDFIGDVFQGDRRELLVQRHPTLSIVQKDECKSISLKLKRDEASCGCRVPEEFCVRSLSECC
jgi:hypothetical protein